MENEIEFQMNKHEKMMNKEGFVCRDDTMKQHELNLEKEQFLENSPCAILCIDQSIKKYYKSCYIYKQSYDLKDN